MPPSAADDVYLVTDGRISEIRRYEDRAPAAAAAGVG